MTLRPRTAEGEAGLAAIRARPSAALIGLDFDGTLSPIVADPSAARAHRGTAAQLRRLAGSVRAVVIVTGRPAADAAEFSGAADIPGLVVLGQYGRERWEAGELRTPPAHPGVDEARDKLPRILQAARVPLGVTIEDKGGAVAVHTRRAAEPQVALERLRSVLAALAERTGLALEPGRFVLELRPPGVDKGAALTSIVEETGAESVLYAGDDLGDLAAFDAVETLRKKGTPGVTVYSSSEEVTPLAERADIVVDGPDGVVALLAELADDLA